MINKVTLIGNLGQDPEIRRLENGAVVARFSVATNENYKDRNGEWQTQTEWHNVVAWRNLAEVVERNFKKGKQVYIEGKLTHRKWQDKEGNDRYTTEVVANTLRLLGRRDETEGSSNYNNSNTQPAANTNPAAPQAAEPMQAADDDLPF
jgi:single-strand DNA-binding protein